jgi:hypothetical protein
VPVPVCLSSMMLRVGTAPEDSDLRPGADGRTRARTFASFRLPDEPPGTEGLRSCLLVPLPLR